MSAILLELRRASMMTSRDAMREGESHSDMLEGSPTIGKTIGGFGERFGQ